MPWLYYKCNDCDYETRVRSLSASNPPVCTCPICNSKIIYSKDIEKAWINELDKDGNRMRMEFKGMSEDDCRKKAMAYFKCQQQDIDYYIIKNDGLFTPYIIRAWKPIFNLTPNMKKIVADPDWIEGWIAIDSINKIIITPRYHNGKPIKYNKISSIKYRKLSSGSIVCELILKPYMEILIDFVPSYTENVDILIDTLFADLPHAENEMYITCFFEKNDIPSNRKICHIEIDNIDIDFGDSCFVWKDADYLCICNTIIRNGMKIKVSDIKYYRIVGDKYVTTEVTGGGSGGASIKGAILGGILAGEAGAIIGSRKSVESVTSSSTLHDKRNVLMYSSDSSIILKFKPKVYNVLLDMLPEKEYGYTNNETKETLPNTSSDTSDIKSKLKKLKSMFEEDLITEEEYNCKRQELLSKL